MAEILIENDILAALGLDSHSVFQNQCWSPFQSFLVFQDPFPVVFAWSNVLRNSHKVRQLVLDEVSTANLVTPFF